MKHTIAMFLIVDLNEHDSIEVLADAVAGEIEGFIKASSNEIHNVELEMSTVIVDGKAMS